MLQELSPDQLWTAAIPQRRMGFECGARMTVVRLPDGGLWIHSPIQLDPDLKRALDALGPVECIVSPARLHYLDFTPFARAYPDATCYAVPSSRPRIQGVPVHGVLGDEPEPEWAAVLDQSLFRGSALYDEADFFHRPSRTLILTDLLFFIPTDRPWLTRCIATSLGILGKLSASKSFHLTMRDRPAIRASLERILAWDFDRVVVSHAQIVETNGKAAFREAFGWFLDRY